MTYLVPFVAALTLLVQPVATKPSAELPDLTVQERASLRCGVAFGLIEKGQVEGDLRAAEYPPLAERGREFFVRAMAKLMDDYGLTRDQVNRLAVETAMELSEETPEHREAMMPACLAMLDASGL